MSEPYPSEHAEVVEASPFESLEVEHGDHADAGACHCAPSVQPPGYLDNKQAHLRRLRRIEGQTRGLQRMIENDEYCIDVLTQISAVTSALKSLSLLLLEEHLDHCVANAVQSGGAEAEAKLAEANAAIARLVRS
ncbi:MAG TPA: metal-sensitive transcriptional regulator [Propionibacteriaceae bacterium]|nr:metal-sensitive transcriptional regulator [Propionibacteriaceae bacterium]